MPTPYQNFLVNDEKYNRQGLLNLAAEQGLETSPEMANNIRLNLESARKYLIKLGYKIKGNDK
jgi:hypothetical protein